MQIAVMCELSLVASDVVVAECFRFEEEERCSGTRRTGPSQDSRVAGVVWTD